MCRARNSWGWFTTILMLPMSHPMLLFSGVILGFLINPVTASITHATCQVCNESEGGAGCDGFLASLPLRTGTQIVTTAIVTGILAAWQSGGSGQGGLLKGLTRTLMQAFVPEIVLFRLHHIGYAMYPKFEEWIVPVRAQCRCYLYQVTKAQIVATHLGLLAVREDPPDLDRTAQHQDMSDAAQILRFVDSSNGWRDVKFFDNLQPGYRLVTLQEAVFLPHLFYALPQGRKTLFGYPIPQIPMVLLFLQAVYYIIYVITRSAKGLYTTVVEWFFIPTSFTLIALAFSAILWEPAWRDIAHLNLPLGTPLEEYPWRGRNTARWYFRAIVCLIVPIGPATTLAAYAIDVHHRPNPVSQVVCAMGITWCIGFLVLTSLSILGHYQPFKHGKRRSWIIQEPTPETGWGWYYSILLVVARTITFAVSIYELSTLPPSAYTQMNWSQYIPHL